MKNEFTKLNVKLIFSMHEWIIYFAKIKSMKELINKLKVNELIY